MIRDSIKFAGITLGLAVLCGCGTSYPSVSGKVTANGQPVEGVKVFFSPVSTKENPFPGPYSEGVTDANGEYSMVTRDGSNGSTKGENIVEFYSVKVTELDFMESEMAMLFAQANGNQNDASWKKAEELRAKVNSLKSVAGGDRMTASAKTVYTVPDVGTDKADFELTNLAPMPQQ